MIQTFKAYKIINIDLRCTANRCKYSRRADHSLTDKPIKERSSMSYFIEKITNFFTAASYSYAITKVKSIRNDIVACSSETEILQVY